MKFTLILLLLNHGMAAWVGPVVEAGVLTRALCKMKIRVVERSRSGEASRAYAWL
jgi:hypothetical protein